MTPFITEYNPETCITAGQLRESGILIPASIPDCGWVSRASVIVNPASAVPNVDHDDPTFIRITTDVAFLEPFRWVCLQCHMP